MKIDTSEVEHYKEQIANAWDLGKKLDTILLLDKKLYVIGGLDKYDSPITECCFYDMKTNKWEIEEGDYQVYVNWEKDNSIPIIYNVSEKEFDFYNGGEKSCRLKI